MRTALASAKVMRIRAFIGVLGVLALASSTIVATGSARPQTPPARFLLHANDMFEVAGSGVACKVLSKGAPYPNRVVCFAETKQRTFKPQAGSYAVELAQGGVAVGRVGSRRPLFVRVEAPPGGSAAGSGQATGIAGARAQLAGRNDRAYVAGTNIVCRLWDQSPRAVLCVLLGSDGRVHDGTYLAWISARGVRVAQEQNRRSVTVFQRVNGHSGAGKA